MCVRACVCVCMYVWIYIYIYIYIYIWRWRSWLRHCATIRKGASSIPDEYNDYFLGGKGGRCVQPTTLPPSCVDCLEPSSRKILEPNATVIALYKNCFTLYLYFWLLYHCFTEVLLVWHFVLVIAWVGDYFTSRVTGIMRDVLDTAELCGKSSAADHT
jgi:hypothetical protein